MDELAPMVVSILFFLGIYWIVKTLSTNKRLDRLARMHADMQTRIIDKFGTSQELLAYFNTEPGKQLLQAPVVERAGPHSRILGAAQAGIVIALAGVASLAVGSLIQVPDPAAFSVMGVLGLAVGIGFLLSAAAAHALSKRYGLFDGGNGPAL